MTTSIVSLSETQSALQVNGLTSVLFDSSGDVQVASINGGQLGGFRNRIINGDMRISQRGPIAAVNSTYTYGGADRICTSVNALTSGSINQLAGSVSGGISGYSHSVLATTSGAGGVFHQTRIEALNTKSLNGLTITVSCTVFQDTGGAINVRQAIGKPTTTADTFSAQTDLNSTANTSVPSSTLTKLTQTYTLGASDASLGLYAYVNFDLPSPVTGKYFTVTDWQLELGSVATPFEQRPYGLELALCQRYYETGWFRADASQTASATIFGSSSNYKETKRTLPTTTFAAGYSNASGGAFHASSTAESFEISAIATGAGGAAVAGAWTAAAEL